MVVIRANRTSLDDLIFQTTDAALNVKCNVTNLVSTCTDIQIAFYLQNCPNQSLSFSSLQVDSLGGRITESMTWVSNNLSVHTTYSNFIMENNTAKGLYFAKNVSIHSIEGSIFRPFVVDKNLERRNEHGFICAFLVVRKLPFDSHRISILTLSSNLFIVSAQQVWPTRVYTHRTEIITSSCGIYARTTHRSYNNISIMSGNMLFQYQVVYIC